MRTLATSTPPLFVALFGAFALVGAIGCSNGSSPGQASGGSANPAQVGSGGGGGTANRGYQAPAKPFVKRPKRTEGKHAIATFAAGCFWCVEAVFEHVNGVDEAVSGYSGGPEQNPQYQQVAAGKTGHTEAIQVHYNPDVIDYKTLVTVLLGSMDPTQVNGQGPDNGRQYRSAIFFHDDTQKQAAMEALAEEKPKHKKPLAVELTKLEKFWPAEDFHQDYEARNPNNGYILAVSKPRLERFKKKFPKLLRSH